MSRSVDGVVLLSLFTTTSVWAGGSHNAGRVDCESPPAAVTNTFLRDNPGYKQRAGSFYETNYLPSAIDSLRQTAALTDEQVVATKRVLTAFISDWLDAYIRGGGCISSESHGLVVAAMDTQMKLALREAQFQKYLAWREGEYSRPNALTFLTMTGGAGSAFEARARSVQSVLPEEGTEGKIKSSPLGFHTLDFSSDFWASLKDDDKMKGKVSDVLAYEDIRKILVLRCNMSVPAGDYLERNLRSAIAAEHQFTVGPLPDRSAADVGIPLLTAVFETKKGDLGLLTTYPRITIVELNGRYGMILTEEDAEPGAPATGASPGR